MKTIRFFGAIFFVFCVSFSFNSFAQNQASPPARSAREAANSDAQFIASSIGYNEDVMYLARRAGERGTDPRLKELAQQMIADHTEMLYSMEQLQTAGGVSPSSESADRKEATAINEEISKLSGEGFDSIWVARMLTLQQTKYDEFVAQKELATNSQLKMAVTQAIPKLRKQVSELKSVQRYLSKLAIQKKKEEAARRKAAELEQRSRK